MRVLKVAKHIYFDIALRDGGNCRESTHRLFEPITLSLIEEVLWYFVSASISISYESIYSCFERSGYFLSFCVASMNNIALTPWAPFFSQFSCSVVSDSVTLNHRMTGLPVHHQHPEFTQTHVHRVGDAIQPSHPLSSPSPPAPNPSQHPGLFQ